MAASIFFLVAPRQQLRHFLVPPLTAGSAQGLVSSPRCWEGAALCDIVRCAHTAPSPRGCRSWPASTGAGAPGRCQSRRSWRERAEFATDMQGQETAETAAAAAPALLWHFSQVFGEHSPGDEVAEADVLSAVEFDSTGEQLATGDRGGRVVLFERVDSRADASTESCDEASTSQTEYRYLTEFQSHEPEFDYLKSQEIEEKINKVRWVQQGANSSRFLLSTNDKTVKLWKVFEKHVRSLGNFNVAADERSSSGARAGPSGEGASVLLAQPGRARPVFASAAALRVPQVLTSESVLAARCRRAYPNAHAYHINSVSVNSDCNTFISADDLRINLWSLEASSSSFTVVDIKPENMENLTEVITSAVFHPTHCALFAFSSSKGTIRLADMRQRARCDAPARLFEEAEPPGARSFFSEIVASISDVQFGAGGRYLLARDYLTLKLWDVAMEARPLATFPVHEGLRSKLCDLYENDAIFDKFECTMSGDGGHVATGTYGNLFRVFSTRGSGEAAVEASKDPLRLGGLGAGGEPAWQRTGQRVLRPEGADVATSGADYGSKLLHLAWHPQREVVAAAAGNSLYIMRAGAPADVEVG